MHRHEVSSSQSVESKDFGTCAEGSWFAKLGIQGNALAPPKRAGTSYWRCADRESEIARNYKRKKEPERKNQRTHERTEARKSERKEARKPRRTGRRE